ncbi:branched-chain amino acid ABC transporter permease [Variovorax sp. J31P207]|uniref:branched-chain amino acid ABC transporter permease n=1 Tax=Variovorax sp. J31P207 TaxID=3053510 RepID=UPI0025788434|nr:branched-chain amino acid ABC transporter permease [Variovorax sp. J31P207]MDM0071428.1 branched-chain amino acid ABC transporter permease [Variovorax sp. J31P207]
MNGLLNQLFSGLVSGAIYGLMALALVMIYQASRHINFAQGEMATFSTLFAWWLMAAGFSYFAAFALTLIASFVGGVVIQRFVLRAFDRSTDLTNVVVFVALMVIFNAMSGWIFGHEVKTFPSPFPKDAWYASRWLPAHGVGALAVLSAIVVALYLFLGRSRVGLAMRAAAYNPASARAVGIRVPWMLGLGWGLAASIGATAGMLIAPIVFLDTHMMSGVLLYAFAGALLGGIDSPWGAVAGGLLVGLVENLLGAYVIGTDLKLTFALILIVATLILRPGGLFGKAIRSRV